MMIHGSPIRFSFPDDTSFDERFWYWRGASGCDYIHSIYAVDACPPLTGAVCMAVKRRGGKRVAVAAGTYPLALRPGEADEIHVHLLARSEEERRETLADLRLALGGGRPAAPFAAAARIPAVAFPLAA